MGSSLPKVHLGSFIGSYVCSIIVLVLEYQCEIGEWCILPVSTCVLWLKRRRARADAQTFACSEPTNALPKVPAFQHVHAPNVNGSLEVLWY